MIENSYKNSKVNYTNNILKSENFYSYKSIDLYEKFIKCIHNLRPKEYFINEFNEIREKTFNAIALDILCKIFGNDITNEFYEYLSIVDINKSKSIFDSYTTCLNNKDSYISSIPSHTSVATIPTVVHEFINYYILKHNIVLENNRYYKEILPIYGEKLAILYINEIVKDNYEEKVEYTRLKNIDWLYYDKKRIFNKIIDTYEECSKSNDLKMKQVALNMKKIFPWVENTNTIINFLNFKDKFADSYGYGYLYSQYLINRYKDDANNVGTQIKDILKNDKSLKEVLNYFNINCENERMYSEICYHIRKL